MGQAILKGTLPGHHFAAVFGGHNARQNGKVCSTLGPKSENAEDHNEDQVHPEQAFPWRKAVELQKHDGDGNGQCQLRAQRPSEAPQACEAIPHSATQNCAQHGSSLVGCWQDTDLPIFQAAELEEEDLLAEDTPRDRCKDADEDQDEKGGHAQELYHSTKLLSNNGEETRRLHLEGTNKATETGSVLAAFNHRPSRLTWG
mmetsp:Transcript_47893/g.97484  ORF Transcript_47893/g.97484 Transcript_47893/m.97484 type:complete len:201 (+) Transcript_47893:502-1104(+)